MKKVFLFVVVLIVLLASNAQCLEMKAEPYFKAYVFQLNAEVQDRWGISVSLLDAGADLLVIEGTRIFIYMLEPFPREKVRNIENAIRNVSPGARN